MCVCVWWGLLINQRLLFEANKGKIVGVLRSPLGLPSFAYITIFGRYDINIYLRETFGVQSSFSVTKRGLNVYCQDQFIKPRYLSYCLVTNRPQFKIVYNDKCPWTEIFRLDKYFIHSISSEQPVKTSIYTKTKVERECPYNVCIRVTLNLFITHKYKLYE